MLDRERPSGLGRRDVERDVEIPVGPRAPARRRGRGEPGLEVPCRDQRTDHRLPRAVEREQLGRGVVVARTPVQPEQPRREPLVPESLALERQERRFGGAVLQSQLGGELEAVDDLRLACQKHVLRPQIPMAVDDARCAGPGRELCGMCRDEPLQPGLELADAARIEPEGRRRELAAVASRVGRERAAVRGAVPRCPDGPRVKPREPIEQVVRPPILDVAARGQAIERELARQVAHFDEPLDGCAKAIEREPAMLLAEWHDA